MHKHILTNTDKHTHTHTHTHLHKVLPSISYSCPLVISSYHRSYQHNFNNLLNYKRKFLAIKKYVSKLNLQERKQ